MVFLSAYKDDCFLIGAAQTWRWKDDEIGNIEKVKKGTIMRLSEEDVQLFYKLYPSLLVYVNSNKNILRQASTPDELMSHPVEEKVKIRDQLYQNIELIDSFLEDNPFSFSNAELEIIRTWKHFTRDRFYLFRHLKKETGVKS